VTGVWGRSGDGVGSTPDDAREEMPPESVPTPSPHAVARIGDIPPDGLLGVTLPDGTPVCLVRHGGAVHALHDRCTHAEYSLSAGELEADGTVQCLWHGATFDCRTGAVRRGPARKPVRTFAVRVIGDEIHVDAGRGNGQR
jgi:3-phenylpropionate/trans-cinnamate dioxygenase ferredoxin subunit